MPAGEVEIRDFCLATSPLFLRINVQVEFPRSWEAAVKQTAKVLPSGAYALRHNV